MKRKAKAEENNAEQVAASPRSTRSTRSAVSAAAAAAASSPVPETGDYQERRARNNAAVQKCREQKKRADETREMRIKALRVENEELVTKSEHLQNQYNILSQLVTANTVVTVVPVSDAAGVVATTMMPVVATNTVGAPTSSASASSSSVMVQQLKPVSSPVRFVNSPPTSPTNDGGVGGGAQSTTYSVSPTTIKRVILHPVSAKESQAASSSSKAKVIISTDTHRIGGLLGKK